MRWQTRKNGTVRKRKGFLFFPHCIKDEWRWLEYAEWTERWHFGKM